MGVKLSPESLVVVAGRQSLRRSGIRQRLVALAALALVGSAAQADSRTYQVAFTGTDTFVAYASYPCNGDAILFPSECTVTPISSFATVTTPSWADGTYTSGVSFDFGYGTFTSEFGADYSSGVSASIVNGQVTSVDFYFESPNVHAETTGESLYYFRSIGSHVYDVVEGTLGATVPIPEPTSLALMLAGLTVCGTIAVRRKA